MIPDWADEVLKVLGGLGLVGALLTAVLSRRTGRETSAAARLAAEAQAEAARAQRLAVEVQERNAVLTAITARVETELKVLDAGQQMWKGMFEAGAARMDQQEKEHAALRAEYEALRAEHRQCRKDVAELRAVLERRRAAE